MKIVNADKLKNWLYNMPLYNDSINDRTDIREHIDKISCDIDKIELNENEWLVVKYNRGYISIKDLNMIMQMLQNNVSSKTIAIPNSMDLSNYTDSELQNYAEWLNKEIEHRKG